MFQNIVEERKEDIVIEDEIKTNKIDIDLKEVLKKSFTKQNIMVYIMSFMLSTVSIKLNGIAPFGLAIFAATVSNGLPAGITFIISLIGTAIGIGGSGALTYILTSLVFVAMILVFKPWYEEEYKSERRKLGKYVFASVVLVQLIQILFKGFLLYDLFLGITTGALTYIFYKIFSNSLITISEYGITKAFTIEEVVGASLMLAIAVTALRNFQIFGFEIKTILCILIVLILGWKKGILIGGASGITIGAVLGIIAGGRNRAYCLLCNFWNNCRIFEQIWKNAELF